MLDAVYFDDGPPSNFYMKAPIRLRCPMNDTGDVHTFKSTEHYLHCVKPSIARNASYEHYLAILNAPTPRDAKYLGRAVPMSDREIEQWDAYIAPVTMLRGCLVKFTTHDHCREWLVATGDRRLIEHRPDPIWGDNMDGTGRNQLGLILEVVRARVR